MATNNSQQILFRSSETPKDDLKEFQERNLNPPYKEVTVINNTKCSHKELVRVNMQTVECKTCRAGWQDGGVWKIENGKVL